MKGARKSRWYVATFFVLHLIGREVMGKKRTQCWPGFDTLVKIPQSKRANESAKLSALCAGKCEWPNRDWLWCRIWLVERFARVFQANTARGKAEPLQSLITFWASIKGALGGRFPTYYNPPSATSQVHTANQPPAILFRDVFPESVQKSFSIITSDYIKFPHKTAALSALVPCIRGQTVIHMFEAGL